MIGQDVRSPIVEAYNAAPSDYDRRNHTDTSPKISAIQSQVRAARSALPRALDLRATANSRKTSAMTGKRFLGSNISSSSPASASAATPARRS